MTTIQKDNIIVWCIGVYNKINHHSDDDKMIQIGIADDICGYGITKRIYSVNGKSPTLTNCGGGNRHAKIAIDDFYYRRLTPLEYERLQTVPDNYTLGEGNISDGQRYKMCGNGWTIEVIAHILSFIFNKNPLAMW